METTPHESPAEKSELTDFEMLEALQSRLYRILEKDENLAKIGELLKVMEMKRKLSIEGKNEKKFWEMIDKIRTDKLTRKEKSLKTRESDAK